MKLINLLIRRNNRVYSIRKFEGNQSYGSIKSIVGRLKEIEYQIHITSQSILEAQLVKFRSVFSKNNNFFDGLQKKVVESSVNTSLKWHQEQLIALRKERIHLQLELVNLTGRRWQRKIIKLIKLVSILIGILISILFLIIGIFTTLYLLPFFIMLLFAFMILNKKIN